METQSTCRRCQSALSETEALQGICPKCLMQLGLWASSLVVTGSGGPPPPLPEPERIAELLPQYSDLALIGHGGMGVVYRGMHADLKRLVAIKVLPPSPDRDPAFAERFMREAQALAGLSHPGIVSVYDFGEREGTFFFAMEFIDGATLRQTMRSGLLEPAQALEIVSQICSALQYAHEHGVVHRDVKPENILIDRSGRVKITDFGLAKMLRSDSEAASLTQTFQVMGTPHYMAPEQFETPTKVDHRADIFSLGVVFYELLTGELPLGRFSPPSQVVRLDTRLDEVVMRTLDKFPEERYQAAEEVSTDLNRITKTGLRKGKDHPRSARGTGHGGSKSGKGLRKWALVGATAIVLVVASFAIYAEIERRDAALRRELQARLDQDSMQRADQAKESESEAGLQAGGLESAALDGVSKLDAENRKPSDGTSAAATILRGDGRDYFRFKKNGVALQEPFFEISVREPAYQVNEDGSRTGFLSAKVESVLNGFRSEFLQMSADKESMSTTENGHLLVRYPAFVEEYGHFQARFRRSLKPALDDVMDRPVLMDNAWVEGVAPYGWKPVEIEIWKSNDNEFYVIERFEGEEPRVHEPVAQLESHLDRLWSQAYVVPTSALEQVDAVLEIFDPEDSTSVTVVPKDIELESAEWGGNKLMIAAMVDAATQKEAAQAYELFMLRLLKLGSFPRDNAGTVSMGRSPFPDKERMSIGPMRIVLGQARDAKLFLAKGAEDFSEEGAMTRIALNQGGGSEVAIARISRSQSRRSLNFQVESWDISGDSVAPAQLDSVLNYLRSLETESGQITVSRLSLQRRTSQTGAEIEVFWKWHATLSVCSPSKH